jgi:hypothetical protein
LHMLLPNQQSTSMPLLQRSERWWDEMEQKQSRFDESNIILLPKEDKR